MGMAEASVLLTTSSEKTSPSRPTVLPGTGCCSQAASRTVRTGVASLVGVVDREGVWPHAQLLRICLPSGRMHERHFVS